MGECNEKRRNRKAYYNETTNMLMLRVADGAHATQALLRAMRIAPGKPGSIFFDINTEEIQPIDNILHMNTDPTKWRLPSEETK